MKIRVMHLTYDMGIGGTEQVIKNLIEGSSRNRFDMTIYCIEEPIGAFGEMLLQNGTEITSRQRQAGFDRQLVRALRRHIQRNAIDILHCHQYTPWAYGALAAAGLKCKVIFTEHGRFYPDRSSWKRRLVNPLLVGLTHRITAISQATKQALTDYEFISADRIEVIYNGIHPLQVEPSDIAHTRSEMGIEDSTQVIGTIARMDPIKNHVMMLNAFANVLEQHPDCRLVIVGDGEERQNLENRVRELNLKNQVSFAGYIRNPGRYLACMNIFLLSSLSEGTSMTLLEAMSLSKPCIVTNAGGNPEIVIDGETGRVTENDDEVGFACAINQLLDNPEMTETLGRQARQRFDDKFVAKSMCEQYANVYRSCQEHGT